MHKRLVVSCACFKPTCIIWTLRLAVGSVTAPLYRTVICSFRFTSVLIFNSGFCSYRTITHRLHWDAKVARQSKWMCWGCQYQVGHYFADGRQFWNYLWQWIYCSVTQASLENVQDIVKAVCLQTTLLNAKAELDQTVDISSSLMSSACSSSTL